MMGLNKPARTYVSERPVANNPFADRPCPEWFRDAKVGIFIHWGPYSVPGWATSVEGMIPSMANALIEDGYDIDTLNALPTMMWHLAFRDLRRLRFSRVFRILSRINKNPYAEWYWDSLRSGGETAKHHKAVWGDRKYEEFGEDFKEASKDWDASDWAQLFREAGAQYVVTTAKHHDGFCLWPSRFPCPNRDNWQTDRDLLGDLKTAVEKENIRFALYYSPGFDWTFTTQPTMRNVDKALVNTPEGTKYFENHMRELVDRYQPDLIWSDIAFPANGDYNGFLEHYYAKVPHGVINDRAQPRMNLPVTRHFDYTTTEYFVPRSIREIPWEICRGVSASFAYNQQDDESTTVTPEELVSLLADTISKNGNLLLGLAPMADGRIPEHQVRTVRRFGEWLSLNRDAIYGSRPYVTHQSKTNEGTSVRFVVRDDKLYVIALGQLSGDISIEGLRIKPGARARLLGREQALEVEKNSFRVGQPTDPAGCCLEVALSDVSV